MKTRAELLFCVKLKSISCGSNVPFAYRAELLSWRSEKRFPLGGTSELKNSETRSRAKQHLHQTKHKVL